MPKKWNTEHDCPRWFIDYMVAFYGLGGLYAEDQVKPFTPNLIRKALINRVKKYPKISFEGDSVDRELVRDECNELLTKKGSRNHA